MSLVERVSTMLTEKQPDSETKATRDATVISADICNEIPDFEGGLWVMLLMGFGGGVGQTYVDFMSQTLLRKKTEKQ